jgi:hypothetical protein
MKSTCRSESLRDTCDENFVFPASFVGMPGEIPLFGRDRCHCVERDAPLSTFLVNSRSNC